MSGRESPTVARQPDGTGHAHRIRTTTARLRRAGRLQTEVLEPWLLCPPDTEGCCDLDSAFGRPADCILDIGFGKGEVLIQMAVANPQLNFIGCELFLPGLIALAREAGRQDIRNLRLANTDARDLLADRIAPEALCGIHLFFPDPWPKKRHHKRRLIQPGFCELMHSRLQPGGAVQMATDWADYGLWIEQHFGAGWRQLSPEEGRTRLPSPSESRFARRGRRAGRPIAQYWFEKL